MVPRRMAIVVLIYQLSVRSFYIFAFQFLHVFKIGTTCHQVMFKTIWDSWLRVAVKLPNKARARKNTLQEREKFPKVEQRGPGSCAWLFRHRRIFDSKRRACVIHLFSSAHLTQTVPGDKALSLFSFLASIKLFRALTT